MSTKTPNRHNADAQYSYHVGPASQGGNRYARCEGCGREILTSIGTDQLEHAPDCPHR